MKAWPLRPTCCATMSSFHISYTAPQSDSYTAQAKRHELLCIAEELERRLEGTGSLQNSAGPLVSHGFAFYTS